MRNKLGNVPWMVVGIILILLAAMLLLEKIAH